MDANARGFWKKGIKRRSAAEILRWREEIDALAEQPAFQQIRALLAEAHDELLDLTATGPVLTQAQYAKLGGMAAGLQGLEHLVSDIRHAAGEVEKQLAERAERPRRREEVGT
jgi:hypothetical protein